MKDDFSENELNFFKVQWKLGTAQVSWSTNIFRIRSPKLASILCQGRVGAAMVTSCYYLISHMAKPFSKITGKVILLNHMVTISRIIRLLWITPEERLVLPNHTI